MRGDPHPHDEAGLRRLEVVVDALAEREVATNSELRRDTGLSRHQVQHALLDAERFGCAARTGKTRGTKWWLT